MTAPSGSSRAGAAGPSDARTPPTTGEARSLQSARGPVPTVAAARSSALSARELATSSISAHEEGAPTQATGRRGEREATMAPRLTSALRHRQAAEAAGGPRRRGRTLEWGRRWEAVSVAARPRPPLGPPPRRAERGQGIPQRRVSPPQQTGDWKHQVLLRCGGGGRRAIGAGQPGR